MSGLAHFDQEIYALDQRIGQLALVCQVDLSRPDVVVDLIKGHYELCAHGADMDPHRRDDLRALLMLKYRIEASCIDALGTEDCLRLIVAQDERLRQRGFPPQSLTDADIPIPLPGPVDESKSKADFKDGVLTLTLPKNGKAKPKAIAVKVG